MANQVILSVLAAAFAVLCVCCFAEYRGRAEGKVKAAYLPDFLLWLGMAAGTVFLVIGWLAAEQDGSVGLTFVFGAFVLPCMALMLGWKNCFLLYDRQGFTQKNIFGMRRSFTYDQVTGWSVNRRNPMESTLYAGGKRISFNLMSRNGPDFLAKVSAGYRKAHGSKNVPEMPELRKERGGFRAHVYNPGEYLAVFLMMVAMVVGLGGWLMLDSWLPVTEKDAQMQKLTFCAWELVEDNLELTSAQTQEIFVINGCRDYLTGMEALVEKCDGETTFTVWAERFTPSDEEPFYRVYALASGDESYRTFEDSTAYRRLDVPLIAGMFGVFLLIVLAFSGFIYMVGSDPQRFPKWVVYACFKKNAIEI